MSKHLAIFSESPGNFETQYWKIAGLWPAIFSGTPRNFEASFLSYFHSLLKYESLLEVTKKPDFEKITSVLTLFVWEKKISKFQISR